jgi:hypothetical protein
VRLPCWLNGPGTPSFVRARFDCSRQLLLLLYLLSPTGFPFHSFFFFLFGLLVANQAAAATLKLTQS